METNNSQLLIYQAPDGNMSIDVTVQNDTVWLSQGQMAELFDKDQSVIARHISNVFKEGELEKESNMQILHNTLSKYKPTQVYSLDVIISVGYRVKSKRGTQFRIWANKILKQYLLQGYAINERIAAQKYDELSQLIKVLGRTIQNQERLTEDSRSLLDVVVDYTYALDTLDRYDYQELKIEDTTCKESFHATYENAWDSPYRVTTLIFKTLYFLLQAYPMIYPTNLLRVFAVVCSWRILNTKIVVFSEPCNTLN